MTNAAVTLPVHCASCGGAVTLQFDTWRPGIGSDVEADVWQEWTCLYCAQTHHGYFPGRLAWAIKGHDDPPLI